MKIEPFSFRNSIEIEDIEDFNCIVEEILSEFVSSLSSDERYIETIFDGEEGETAFTNRAMQMIERYKDRLGTLAQKYFEEDELIDLNLDPPNLFYLD